MKRTDKHGMCLRHRSRLPAFNAVLNTRSENKEVAMVKKPADLSAFSVSQDAEKSGAAKMLLKIKTCKQGEETWRVR